MVYVYAASWSDDARIQNPGTGLLVIPTSAKVCLTGTSTLATLYTDRTKATTAANPVLTGQAVGTVGVDVNGNLLVCPDPGTYDIYTNGALFATVMLPTDPAEPAPFPFLPPSPNGSIYQIVMSDAGVISTTLVTGGASGGGTTYTRPTSANTGYAPTGVTLTSHTGDITVTVDNTVIDSLDVHGRIIVQAANVLIKRCRVRGTSSPSSNTALIVATSQSCVGLIVQDCLLVPDSPTLWLDAILGHDYTIQRCEAYNVVDFAGVYNNNSGHTNDSANVNIYSNYAHDFYYQATGDPNHSDGHTHNDGVQIQGNGGVNISGNTILLNQSSASSGTSPYSPSLTGQCIGVTPNVSNLSHPLNFTYNWLDYGAQCITVIVGGSPNFYTVTSPLVVSNNQFGDNSGNLNTPSLLKNSVTAQRPILIDSTIVSAHMTGWTTGRVTDTNGNVLWHGGTAITDDSYAGAS